MPNHIQNPADEGEIMSAGTTGRPDDRTTGRPVDLTWRKAQASGQQGGCVEFAFLGDGRIAVRDSKNPDGAWLHFSPHEVSCFLTGAKAGEFDEFAAGSE